MRSSHPPATVLLRAGLVLTAGLALLIGAAPRPAAAAAAPSPVPLGTHRFGHLRQPATTVARDAAGEVGFWESPKGADGAPFGPWSFDVARDGSIWLLDEVNHRLLVWRPGQPERPAHGCGCPSIRCSGSPTSRSRPTAASTPLTCPQGPA